MGERARALLVFHGGTFDPVHCGHLAVAEAARDLLGTTVRLLPSADPPHRPPTAASARQRADMLSLAVEGRRGLRVDLRELDRGVPSRTIDTLHAVRATAGEDCPIAFVLGADSFLGLPSWKGWPALVDEAHWVVAGRGGHLLDHADAVLVEAVADRWSDDADRLRETRGGRVLRLEQPLHPASASLIRTLVAAGEPAWKNLVPDAVAAYIDHHRLYMASGAGSAPIVPPL